LPNVYNEGSLPSHFNYKLDYQPILFQEHQSGAGGEITNSVPAVVQLERLGSQIQ